jgi:hypothetical protein
MIKKKLTRQRTYSTNATIQFDIELLSFTLLMQQVMVLPLD